MSWFKRQKIARVADAPPRLMLARGQLDICQQRHVAGWAICNDGPATVAVEVNGREVARLETTYARPDVCAAFGLEGAFGFDARLDVPIGASDDFRFSIVGTEETIDPAAHRARVEALTYGISRGEPGLEIGPLDNPFLAKEAFSVLYVDHASRADLLEKYKSTGKAWFDASQVVETDFVWTPGLVLAECLPARKFAYAVASQTMEHVADPIGWLNGIADCLKPGGRINLSLPDMRRTFDHQRRLSTASDMLDAYERRIAKPDFRQVFDHIANVAQPPGLADRSPDVLRQALSVARLAVGQYIDVHCYVWTHESFLDCWDMIEKIGCCKAKLDRSWAPVSTHQEFIVSFTT
jgi:hypothetical protein